MILNRGYKLTELVRLLISEHVVLLGIYQALRLVKTNYTLITGI